MLGQSLSKTHIIYESKDQIIMNNGKQYQILAETHFDKNSDSSISQQKEMLGHVLSLNRILVLKNDEESIKLVEWSNDNIKFYEYPKVLAFLIEEKQESNFDLQAND
ncbi:hypothetical protein GCM10022258_35210 [Aquimarina gracilis]